MARKETAATAAAEELVEALEILGSITSKRMFGGVGIFESGVMFALITSEGDAYFRVTELNQARFDAVGTEQFSSMPYRALPDGTLDDRDQLHDWATECIRAAHGAKKT